MARRVAEACETFRAETGLIPFFLAAVKLEQQWKVKNPRGPLDTMSYPTAFVCIGLFLTGGSDAELPLPILYLPLDGTTTAAIAGGDPFPRQLIARETILTLADLEHRPFLPGKVGRCYEAERTPLVYQCAGNFDAAEGTMSLWLSPNFRGDDTSLYCGFFGADRWGMLYKYVKHSSLTFGTARPQGDLYYNCGTEALGSWRPGDWHHVAITWSRRHDARAIYLDGKLAGKGPFPAHAETRQGPLYIGGSCSLYPGHVAHGRLDEVAIWDRPLPATVIAEVYRRGAEGIALWMAAAPPQERFPLAQLRPKRPACGDTTVVSVRPTSSRQVVDLGGWWQLLPLTRPAAELPAAGWGQTKVPGYWTANGQSRDPQGKPVRGRWVGRPLKELTVAYLLRDFLADPAWREHSVFLELQGVDGLAEVFLNGQLLGRLPAWEKEAYDVSSRLHYGQDNQLAVVLHTATETGIAGIYGKVALRIGPASFVDGVVVQPLVQRGEIRFSCDVWHCREAVDARLVLDVTPDKPGGGKATRFEQAVRLQPADRSRAELSAQTQRVQATFAWEEAHAWTFDDPSLYRVRALLHVAGQVVDESVPSRFGYRELTVRGSQLLLNGKPTHLRGHQIDLGWSDQFERVRELKAAGMNCLELSGPVSCRWNTGRPYRGELFEQILDYADEHGLIAIPILPAAREIKERIFEPEVARLYERRVDKHIRRWGNHPSIGMWYMNFNLAGYRWYHPPTKIDGSYKPSDPTFLAKERYSLEAERLAHSADRRPIYHHACGNFGSIFTLNCYIGPTAPLQEREEWPSRWAAQRPFPLIACEHGLMLVPYWYRPRRFPLSEVYSDEPIFDELAAKYLGRRAYRMITPELFDLYDTDGPVRSTRTRRLVVSHPGYQQVKLLFARSSLRAWRTYGVSGIIFNAINWDFKDAGGQPLPVMQALARYFGDLDLYIAGPGADWPSKDHSFFGGEAVRKQVVLLNDLTRDMPCPLRWRLEDSAGTIHASGSLAAVAEAGQASKYPLELTLPQVRARQSLQLIVEPASGAGTGFRPESFALQVFPANRPQTPPGHILAFDPVGETTRMLAQAGARPVPLDEDSDLAKADLLIVGKRAYGPRFIKLARKLGLQQAIHEGLNLIVFEQTSDQVFGLNLREQSARRVFIAHDGHPVLEGLAPEDFVDLRGQSDLVDPYPDAPPETEHAWPKRYFKWGNRGVVATFVYRKPHYAPFVPLLECGFDLVDTPLLEARLGRGSILLCQVDVTSRYGMDPVATRLVTNALAAHGKRGSRHQSKWACVGESARAFLARFGITAEEPTGNAASLIAVGAEALDVKQYRLLTAALDRGSTVLFLAAGPAAERFGLQCHDERLFMGQVGAHPLLVGLNDGDTYFKQWRQMRVARASNGWQALVEPGLVAVKQQGRGRLIACLLDVSTPQASRGQVKALRFWNILLANLGGRNGPFLESSAPRYEPNPWEEIPPFINW